MDLNFEQMLAQHNENFKEAEVFDNWMPPVGSYVVSIIKFDCGQGSKNDPNLGWWRLTCRIEDVQDAELNGKDFTVFYSTKAPGILKGAARVISGDATLNDLTEAHNALEASVGEVATVEILTTIGKNQKTYKNCYFREIINTTEASAVEPAGSEILPDGVTEGASAETVMENVAPAPVEVPVEVPPPTVAG